MRERERERERSDFLSCQVTLSQLLYLLMKLPELSISPVHIPFLFPDPDIHLVNMVCIGTTPLFNHRWNPDTD